jgi:hypothetical protein
MGCAPPVTACIFLLTHHRRQFANRVPPASVATNANGADDLLSAPFARSGIYERLTHNLVYVVVVAIVARRSSPTTHYCDIIRVPVCRATKVVVKCSRG